MFKIVVKKHKNPQQNHDLCVNVLCHYSPPLFFFYHPVQSIELFQVDKAKKIKNTTFSQRSSVTRNSQTPTGFLQETNTSFHGARNRTCPVWAFISEWPFPFPVWLNHYQSFHLVTYFLHVAPLWYLEHFERAPLLFFADFACGLHHQIPGLCGHHAAELNHSSGKDYLRGGGKGRKEDKRPRREEVEEGSRCRQTSCRVYAMSLVFRFISVTQSQVPIFEETKKKSTSQGFGFRLIIPSTVLPCVGSEGAVDV